MRIVGALLLALAGAVWLAGRGAAFAAALPALGYCLVMLTFARTLRPGHEPLIATYARLRVGRVPDEIRGYARGLTWLWTLLMGALTIEALALPWLGEPAWVATASLLNAAVMITVFVGEHAVRRLVFPHLPPASPLHTCRIMLQALRSRG
jgi:uncharacterized membrane protein